MSIYSVMLPHTAAYQRPCPSLVIARSTLLGRSSSQRLAHAPLHKHPPRSSSRTSRTIQSMADDDKGTPNQGAVLFVCLGNICRSPTAEAVFTAVAQRRGVAQAMAIDSCGTGGGSPDWYREGGWSYHEGDAADGRMRDHASRRGISLTSRSRPLTPQDLTTFDNIVAMVCLWVSWPQPVVRSRVPPQDDANVQAIVTAAEYWKSKHDIPANYRTKVVKMCSYLKPAGAFADKYDSVPDPYYGGAAGFELVRVCSSSMHASQHCCNLQVLDLLEDACEGLLDRMQSTR